LKTATYYAEKVLRKRGAFDTVLWMAERCDGSRQFYEAVCTSPAGISDTQV
jgi:hypothetical protein